MGRKKTGHVRGQIHLSPEIWSQIRQEAKDRKMTLGELVEEAFMSRMRMIKK